MVRRRAAIAALLVVGCSSKAPRDFSTRSTTVTSATVSGLTLEIVETHWGTHTAACNGQGRGGFLDGARDTVHMTATANVKTADGKSLSEKKTQGYERGAYEAWVKDWQLFQSTWDSTKDEDAVEAWEKAWKAPKVERCDAAGGVALAMAKPGTDVRTWVWISARGSEMTKHAKVDAPTCDALKKLL